MNRRAVVQVLIILLLILLLAFWALGEGRQQKKATRREGPTVRGATTTDVPVRRDEAVLEEAEELSKSPPEENKAIAEAISHSGWVNNGSYKVFGEVQNVGASVARRVTAQVIFKNSKWQRVGLVRTLVDKPTLAPGQKSAFEVVLKSGDPERVASYVLLFTVER